MPDASGPSWRKLGGSTPLIRFFFFFVNLVIIFLLLLRVYTHSLEEKKKAAFDFMLSV